MDLCLALVTDLECRPNFLGAASGVPCSSDSSLGSAQSGPGAYHVGHLHPPSCGGLGEVLLSTFLSIPPLSASRVHHPSPSILCHA